MERNIKQRNKITEKIKSIQNEREKTIDECVDKENWQNKIQKVYEKYDKILIPLLVKEFSLRFPKRKNTWFSDFCSKYKDGTTRITEKEFRVFERYCEKDPCSTHSIGIKYCRIGNRFVTIEHRKNNTYIVDFFKLI